MPIKKIMVVSSIIAIFMTILTVGIDSVVKMIDSGQTANDPSLRSGNSALRANLWNSKTKTGSDSNGTMSSGNPGSFSKFLSMTMERASAFIEDSAKTYKAPVLNSNQTSMGDLSSTTFDQMLIDQPLDAEQLAEIKKYSGGKSPEELFNNYCTDVKSSDFQEMSQSIKESYANDPNSPAALIDLFEKMSVLCPSATATPAQ
jgi:hypothetical protein